MAVDVVAALVVENGKFMICQRPAHKARGLLWEFVGGKVEQGETREQALVRECREELGVIVAPGEIYMEVDHVYHKSEGCDFLGVTDDDIDAAIGDSILLCKDILEKKTQVLGMKGE